LVAIFAACAAAIWVAGIKLSQTTDVLATRLHFGEALGGLILLALATNLPEIAITASAAIAHNLDIAIGNILGGHPDGGSGHTRCRWCSRQAPVVV